VLRRDPYAVVVGSRHRLAGRDAVALRDLRGETLRFFPRARAPRYYDDLLAALQGTGETFEVWENPLPGLRSLNVSLSERGFMVLPAALAGQLPAGVVCLALTDDLPTIDLGISRRRDATPAVRLLVRTARDLARRERWPR